MPELPDVEAFRRVLDACGTGHRVVRVEVADAGVLRDVSTARLRRGLEGRRFRAAERRGKWLLGRTDGPTVLFHFGMTGRLVPADAGAPRERWDRVAFRLDDGRELRFRDQRKLRGIWLAPTDEDAERVIGDQGPDALAVGDADFARRLAGRRGGLKGALLDQSVVAGLGNLLSDEILWQARLHPAARADRLTDAERRRLVGATHHVLADAVPAGHVPADTDGLTGHRRDRDGTCPRCGGPLAHGRIAGRSTVWCPHCQPDPRA
ncbi:Fpg/Nei family DNA glycosylase [Streptomyces sp. NPDC049879]|uniref:Fpg/Nei family DNA glycosylase n=1 Tax=Streptomyces sp. NPDC049879 TaxID=3365598 RepID=UPI003795A5A4